MPPRWLGRLFGKLLRLRRHETIVLHLPEHLHAARPPMQRVPNLKQHSVPVLTPLPVPKPQNLDIVPREELLPLLVPLHLPRHAMLKSIQFHCQSRGGTVKVQNIFSGRMLAAKLEASEPPRPQCAPQASFLVRLLTAQTARIRCANHI